MKKISWEIVLAGLFCLGMAIYIVSSGDSPETSTAPDYPASEDSLNIQLKDFELNMGLEQLERAEELKKLEKLEKLESLKQVANFLPAEVKDEFLQEINMAINEQEQLKVIVNRQNGSITINQGGESVPGTWTAASPGVFTYFQNFESAALEEAFLELPYGSIEVTAGTGEKGTLRIEASGQISTRNDLTRRLKVIEEISSNGARFHVERINPDQKENIHLRALIEIPANTQVQLQTEAGHIESSSLTGNQEYQTGGGHITLNDLSGTINALTSGGHIEASKVNGTFKLESRGGHIRVQDGQGTIYMKTSGGNLVGSAVQGNINAETSGGNIELNFRNLTGVTEASTRAGSIILRIPSGSNTALNLSGSTVDVAPSLSVSGDISKNSVIGNLGDGSQSRINAKTNFGKVILKPND